MNFNDAVIPLLAFPHGEVTQHVIGSGFLVRINDGLFLATVAHLGDPIPTPRLDWSFWPATIFLVNRDSDPNDVSMLAELSLFDLAPEGGRLPRFKYAHRPEPGAPGIIQDIILLPIQEDDYMAALYTAFDLPAERGKHEFGATVTMLGRRNEFPGLSTVQHTLTLQGGPARYMIPEGQDGDSGGPVVTTEGLLIGMNVGTHKQLPGHAMLISAEAIEALATSVDGNASDWPTASAAQS